MKGHIRTSRRPNVVGLHLLRALNIKEAKVDTPDGGGLWLRVKGDKALWILRYTHGGTRRDLSLGACYRTDLAQAGKSLTDARSAAATARSLLAAGKDPVDERKAQRKEAKAGKAAQKAETRNQKATLLRYVRAYHEKNVEPIRSAKHSAQWISSISGPPADKRTPEQHEARQLLDELLAQPLGSITPVQALDALVPLCRALPETGFRVAQRLSVAFDAATIDAIRPDNPIRPIGRELRRRAGRISRGSFAALDYRQVPAFVKELRTQPGTAARALEFALLTVARTSEVLEMPPEESDETVWRIPGARMKARVEHVVYLPPRAIEILKDAKALGGVYVFPSPTNSTRPLSNMAMLNVLRRMKIDKQTTVHGVCRSSFSTWANETGAARPDVIEACLAHKEQDVIRRTYNKAQFIAERKALLRAWEDYLAGNLSVDTVPLQKAA